MLSAKQAEAIFAVIDVMGLSRADVIAALSDGELRKIPTVAEFVPKALKACPEASRAIHAPVLHYIGHPSRLGNRRLDEVFTHDLDVLQKARREEAQSNPRAKTGASAEGHFVDGARFLFRQAKRDNHIVSSPAADLKMPKRPKTQRRPLEESELAAILEITRSYSRDPLLDELLLDFLRENRARRKGAINLTVGGINAERRSVTLVEKYGNEREVPVSSDLIERLLDLSHARGAVLATDNAFRYSSGKPMTKRRIDRIFATVQEYLPWARALGVSAHWIRHTVLKDVETVAGYRVAVAYAGHSEADVGVTALYTRVDFEELRAAHDAIFGCG